MPKRCTSARATHAARLLLVFLAAVLALCPPTTAFASSLADELARAELELIAYEEEHGVGSGADWRQQQLRELSPSLAAQADDANLPVKFDLRDRGVVTPVKSQDPWGSCWAFGAIAASETSILSELGTTYEALPLDLSERQVAWFSGVALPDAETMAADESAAPYASQAGEGITPVKSANNPTASPFNTGGTAFYATTLFASGTGVLVEDDAPYKNDENMVQIKSSAGGPSLRRLLFHVDDSVSAQDQQNYDLFVAMKPEADLNNPTDDDIVSVALRRTSATEELAKAGGISGYAAGPIFDENGLMRCSANNNSQDYSWGLPLSKRFLLNLELEESASLPSPASTNEDGRYVYDPVATTAIKQELMAGRGVHIEFCADTSRPGQEPAADAYINTDTWAHYSYDRSGEGKKVVLNHDVCIVGWDDSYAVENFNQGTYTNPETGATVNRFPPAPGAWIVKNSWGAKDRGFPHEGDWGVAGTGYFYLSYYDMSLTRPNTYNFFVDNMEDAREGIYLNQYDFMPAYDVGNISMTAETPFANVFVAEKDQLVRTLTVETAAPDTHVMLKLYRLDKAAPEASDAGTLDAQADEAQQTVSNPEAGELLETVEADYPFAGYHRLQLDRSHFMEEGQRFSVVATMSTTASSGAKTHLLPTHSFYNEKALAVPSVGKGLSVTAHGVVNRGESFVMDDDGWTDWVDQIQAVRKAMGEKGEIKDYDNFALKAFADENTPFTLTKEIVDLKDVYYPGDEVAFRLSVKNDSVVTLEDVEVSDSLVDLGDEGKIASISTGESATIEYRYTVSEEDAVRGSLTNTAKASLAKVEGLEATAELTVKCAKRANPAPAPDNGTSNPTQAATSSPTQAATSSPTQATTSAAKLPRTGDPSMPLVPLGFLSAALITLACARTLRRD